MSKLKEITNDKYWTSVKLGSDIIRLPSGLDFSVCIGDR